MFSSLRCVFAMCIVAQLGSVSSKQEDDEGNELLFTPAFENHRIPGKSKEELGNDYKIWIGALLNDPSLLATGIAEAGDPEALDRKGYHPMHAAAFHGNLDSMKLLASYDAQVDRPSKIEGVTPLHLAAMANNGTRVHLPVVKWLLEQGANPNSRAPGVYNFTVLAFAVSRANLLISEALIDAGASITERNHVGQSMLHGAVLSNSIGLSAYLIKLGVDVNSIDHANKTALGLAAELGHINMVELLIAKNASINGPYDYSGVMYPNVQPLHLAAFKNHDDVVQLLVKKGANADAIVHICVMKGNLHMVNLFLDMGVCSVNALNEDRVSLLQLAAVSGKAEIAKSLLQRGASALLAHRSNPHTPLALAERYAKEWKTKDKDLGHASAASVIRKYDRKERKLLRKEQKRLQKERKNKASGKKVDGAIEARDDFERNGQADMLEGLDDKFSAVLDKSKLDSRTKEEL